MFVLFHLSFTALHTTPTSTLSVTVSLLFSIGGHVGNVFFPPITLTDVKEAGRTVWYDELNDVLMIQ